MVSFSKFISSKYILFSLLLPLVLVVVYLYIFISEVNSQTFPINREVAGYAWSDNIGWISMNCSTGGPGGADICSTSNYAVRLNLDSADDGNLEGYGWSDSIGWVNFNGVPLQNGEFLGYATAESGRERVDGWDGLISMSTQGIDTVDYGVTYSPVTGAFGGYAWGSDVVGWVSFSGADYGVVIAPPEEPSEPGKPVLRSGFPLCNYGDVMIGLTYSKPASGDEPFTYEIYRSTDGINNFESVGTDDNTSFTDAVGLSLNSTYYYKVTAENDSGVSDYSVVSDAIPTPSTCQGTAQYPSQVNSFIAVPGIINAGGTCNLRVTLAGADASTTCQITGSGGGAEFSDLREADALDGSTGYPASYGPVQTEAQFKLECWQIDQPEVPIIPSYATCKINPEIQEVD